MARILIPALSLAVLCTVIAFPFAAADHGGISYDSGVMFDEKAQNAIIAWNGREEMLVLTTDVRSDNSGRLLEFLPLPACPRSITEGSMDSFWVMTGLFDSHTLDAGINSDSYSLSGYGLYYPGVKLAMHTSVGPHDITVVKVTGTDSFVQWVTDFSRRQGVSPPVLPAKLKTCVAGYVQRDINYFAFDVVQLEPDVRTISPLVYRFVTDFLYYPLDVTRDTLSPTGWYGHNIQLFTVTQWKPKAVMHDVFNVEGLHGYCLHDKVSVSTLFHASEDIAGLFPTGAYVSLLSKSLATDSDLKGLHDLRMELSDFLDPLQIASYRLTTAWNDFFSSPSIASVTLHMDAAKDMPYVVCVAVGMFFYGLVLGKMLVRLFKRLASKWIPKRMVPEAYSLSIVMVVLCLFLPFNIVKVVIMAVTFLAISVFLGMPVWRIVKRRRYGSSLKRMWKEPIM